jgi:hypothetical protein
MRLSAILRSINVLNILLAAALLLFAYFVVLPLTDTKVQYIPPAAKKGAPASESTEEAPPPAAVEQFQSPAEYYAISEQNLFHPERRIPPEKKEAPPLPKPEFVLYGTLVTDDLQIAYMDDRKAPYSTPGRGSRQQAIKLGQSISGFILKEIGTDRVLMVRGEESMVVQIEDSSKPKSRDVTGVGPSTAPAPGAAPGAPAPAGGPTPRQRGVIAPAPQPAPGTPQPDAAVTPQAAPAVPPAGATQQPAQSWRPRGSARTTR